MRRGHGPGGGVYDDCGPHQQNTDSSVFDLELLVKAVRGKLGLDWEEKREREEISGFGSSHNFFGF